MNQQPATSSHPVLAASPEADEKKGWRTYLPLLQLARSYPISWWSGLLIFTLMLLEVGTQLASPLLTQSLVDGLTTGESVTLKIVILSALMISGSLIGGFMFWFVARLASRWVNSIRVQIIQRLLQSPVSYFEDGRSSEPASHMVKDTSLIQDLFSHQTIDVLSGMIVVFGCVIVMGALDIVLTLVLLGIVLTAFVITVPIAAGLTKLSKQLQEQEAETIGSFGEILSEIKLVKSMSAESFLIEQQKRRVDRLLNFELKEIRIQAMLGPLVGVAISAGMIAILAFGSYRVSTGAISLGKLLAFILYLFNIVIPLASLSMFVASLNKAAGAADKISSFLGSKPEPFTDGIASPLSNANIELQQLCFKFGDKAILSDISLTIPARKMTALVGESGAGKTTLLNLLDRLYAVGQNQILLGGECSLGFALDDWRRQVSMVSQSAPVISGTMRENLTLGLESIPHDDQMRQLIQDLGLDDIRFEGSDVLDGIVKENGKNFSGGQKQRIAIARAILRNPNLLLLDEPTAALDSLTEKKVTAAIAELSHDTTTVVAAHRLSTVTQADQIVVMKNGEIVDVGPHHQLYKRCAYYQDLVQHQMLDTN